MPSDTPAPDPQVEEELAEQDEEKESQVLKREGVEQELMQDDVSEAGEAIEAVEEDGA